MEEQGKEKKGFIEGKLIIVVLVLLIVIGISLTFAAMALYPDVIVHEDRVNATSEFTSTDRIELEPETYEVWTSTSFSVVTKARLPNSISFSAPLFDVIFIPRNLPSSIY